MEKARKHPRDQAGNSPRVHQPQPTMAPVGSVDSDTHRIPGHRPEELEEGSVPQDQGQVPIGCPEGSHLQAGATTESRSSLSADQGQRQKTHAQEEEEWVLKGDPDEAQKMLELLDSFSQGQLTREEAHRQSAFPRAAIGHLVQSAAGGATLEQNALIAMAGLAKVFVGEVVEEALDVCERWGERARPAPPKHLREAVRRLRAKGQRPNIKPRNVLFP
ncbi:PREDICTED: transcription initiation factor TFIID subunit 11 [Myotis brandtii]|uniref:transcription initiation factor TFIID subunit 11 n=1 Tax=Myotis brandtii TaxID=109478 RepID=UPI0003BB70DC|nr:PREDICTED: transcription initiation factor TFIID subunit 11 [Myotis brandtii]